MLRVLAIANTHTMTVKASFSDSCADDHTVQSLHFAPYTPHQLLGILTARLAPLCEGHQDNERDAFLPNPTLTLLTKKIAALTGDVRALFEVLRGAIELAVTAAAELGTSDGDSNPMCAPALAVKVSPAHILMALKAYSPSCPNKPLNPPATSTVPMSGKGAASETATIVRGLGMQARLVLLVLILASRRFEAGLGLQPGFLTRSGPTLNATLPRTPTKPKSPIKRSSSTPTPITPKSISATSTGSTIDTSALYAYYCSVLTRSDNEVFAPVSRSELADVLGLLETVGLVSMTLISPSSSPGLRSPTKRSASFGGAVRMTGAAGHKGAGSRAVMLAARARSEEVLRGLGIDEVASPETHQKLADVKEEAVCAIWAREGARLARDCMAKAADASPKGALAGIEFEGATED